jgi:O-antigen ligase
VPGFVFAGSAVVLLSFAEGGFESRWWPAATIGFLAAAALVLVLRGRPPLGRAELATGIAFAALIAWTAFSAAWSGEPHDSRLEAGRTTMYLALLVAAWAIRGALLFGTFAGIIAVCGYSIGQRLAQGPPSPPDPYESTLLAEPLGYANALGCLAAVGLAIAVWMTLRSSRFRFLGLAAGAVFVVVLALTGSRGGWFAAAVGGAVAIALQRERVKVAWIASMLAACVLLSMLALSAPRSLAEDLSSRLGDRPWYWHVAWQEAGTAPIRGTGAGAFDLAWLERRPIDVNVQDAHSLYLETFAELGIVGLVLLGIGLAVPLVVGLRSTATAGAAAGYIAFLVHAGVDWDWEMPAVTVAGLLCAAAVLVTVGETARSTSRSHLPDENGYLTRGASPPTGASRP